MKIDSILLSLSLKKKKSSDAVVSPNCTLQIAQEPPCIGKSDFVEIYSKLSVAQELGQALVKFV